MKEILRKAKKVAVALTAVAAVVACSDFLDQEVAGNTSEDDFYDGSIESSQNALISTYDQYGNAYNAVWSSAYLIREIPGDDVNAGGSDENDQQGHQKIDDFLIDASNDQLTGAWGNLWLAVFRANKTIEKTAPGDADRDRIIAEAKTLRAMIYLDLVSLWGGVPIITKDVPAAEYTTQVRASREECLAFIAQDCAEAIPALPAKTALTDGNKFRVSKATAQAVRGKALLYAGDYSNAASQLEELILSNQCALEPKLVRVFDKNYKFGPESLYEINYGGNNAGFAWGENVDNNIIIQLCGPRGDYYVPAPGDTLTGGWGFCPPTDEVLNFFGADKRRQQIMMTTAELEDAGGDWTKDDLHDFEGVLRRKYGTYTNQAGFPGQSPADITVNYGTSFVLYRYADVLLMAAEAFNRSNNDAKAQTYLNMVRARPSTNMPAIASTGDALYQAIKDERRLELAFEGFRFIDLVRWGDAEDELSDLGFVKGKNEYMPIPQNDVKAGKLAQNPGYL